MRNFFQISDWPDYLDLAVVCPTSPYDNPACIKQYMSEKFFHC